MALPELLLADSIYTLLTGESGNGQIIPGRNTLRSYFDGQSRSSIADMLSANHSLMEGLSSILKQTFHIEIVKSKNSYALAGLRQFVPALTAYLQGKDCHSASLQEEFVERKYSRANYPMYSELDGKIKREGITWFLQPEIRQNSSEITIRPLEKVEDISEICASLENSPWCFYSYNSAQLYLYAAHQDTQLLVIRQDEEPIGIIPLLMLNKHSVKRKERRYWGGKKYPVLYAEAFMLNNVAKDLNVVVENQRVSLYDALRTIISAYAGMHSNFPFPVVGNWRKSGRGTAYAFLTDDVLKTFSAQHPGYGFFPNIFGRQKIGASGRKATRPWYNWYGYFDLPEDRELLQYLKQSGYKPNKLVMLSQAFINSDKLRKRFGDYGEERVLLSKDWGEVKGWSSYFQNPGYGDVLGELYRNYIRDIKGKEVNSHVAV